MESRRFEEIPSELREGWEPAESASRWVELLGPYVPEDVKRWVPDEGSDGGFLIADPHELLAADNSFARAVEMSTEGRVLAPVLQVLTSTYFFAEVPHEGDCLMFFCPRESETAEVTAWNHETGELYGPLAYDLPTIKRLLDVSDSSDAIENRREALRPALGRWELDTFPLSLFEGDLARDDVWSIDDDWPQVAAPRSSYAHVAGRAYWVACALINAAPLTDHIVAQLDASPVKALARADFQNVPYTALYWLWRTYFLGETDWHATIAARCKESDARLVRDAVTYLEARGGDGALAAWRRRAIEIVDRIRNPFPASVQVGPLTFERDDSLARLEPEPAPAPTFKCKPGQTLNAFWPEAARLAVPHPDGVRWLVEGHHDHPRKGKHPSISSTVDALFEVDPTTGEGTLWCETPGEGSYTKWGEYLDEDHLLVINNGRLRLYERIPRGTGRGYLIDSVPLRQEKALVMRDLDLVVGFGGVPRMTDNGWQTVAETLSCARLVDRRLKPTATIELALAHVADHDSVLVGRNADKTAGYRLEGLSPSPVFDRIALAPTHFVVPEKVWRAGPSAVLDSLGPMDVSIESPAGLCLINKLVTDPAGARRAYVGGEDGIRPTSPELEIIGYTLMSPTVGCVVTATETHRVDLETGEATWLFDHAAGSQVELLRAGFIVLSGAELVARSRTGEELARIRVPENTKLLTPLHGGGVLAASTGDSPLVLLTLRESTIHLLGSVRPDGALAGLKIDLHAVPQWHYRIVAKAGDGRVYGLRGIDAVLSDPDGGVALTDSLPEKPWELGPEICPA